MKKVKIICFFALTGLSSLAQASSQSVENLKHAYLSEANRVIPYEQGSLSSIVAPSSPAFYDEDSDNQSSLFGAEGPRKMSSAESSILLHKGEEQEELFHYLNNSNFRQNEILTPDLYTQILRDEEPRNDPDFLERSINPCQSKATDVLNSSNIDDLSRPFENMEQQHQFCGFESEYLLGSFNSSINFCECVRDKTNQGAETEEGLYKQVSDPEDFRQAMDLYRQSLVNKVMPGLLEEVDDITSASNDFLSTDELSHMLYEVHTDEQVEDEDTRTLLEKTRQGMHACSGLGMANLMKELYAPSESGQVICDQKSAEFLLEGFVNTMEECQDGQCDDYRALSGSDMYEEQNPQDILSDFMTHKYSVNLIKSSNIFDENFSTLSDYEKYSKVVTTADAMTEFDPSGRPFVNPGMVERERRLPTEEQLLFLHNLSQNPKNSAELAGELSDDELSLLDDVMTKLARNALYRDQTYFARSYNDLTNEEKVGSLRGFVRKIESDKERRIQELPFAKEYFESSENPVEAMQKMITNNYLYLGDDVTKSCARTRRKLKKLCSSISGDGLALFSHPDFRNHTDEMLLDADLQKEVSEIANDGKDGRSPLADQLYCHANYSSMSADCDEDADMKNNAASSSYHHCFYDGDWLFSDDYSEIGKGATGNNRLANQSLLQEAKEVGSDMSAGQNDFLSVVNSKRDVPTYKPIDQELTNVANFDRRPNLNELEVDTTQRQAPEIPETQNAEALPAQNLTEQKPVSSSQNASETRSSAYSNSVSERVFSQNFKNIEANQIQPENVEKATQDEAQTVLPSSPSRPSAAQTLRNTRLQEQLNAAERRQAKLEAQLDGLLGESEEREDEEHQEKLEQKSAELENLQGEIRQLESEIDQEKQAGQRNRDTQENINTNTPTRSRTTSAPRRSQATSAGSDQFAAPSASHSASTSSDSASPESADSSGTAQRSPASVGNSGFALRSADSQQLLPRSIDLTSVAKQLRDENYILLDIGEPGKAEKVVFESGPDGEVLFNESGGPLIASREVIELEGDEQADLEQDELGEVDDAPSYRWNEVERLLDLKTD